MTTFIDQGPRPRAAVVQRERAQVRLTLEGQTYEMAAATALSLARDLREAGDQAGLDNRTTSGWGRA